MDYRLIETNEALALQNALFDAMPEWMATKIFKAIVDLIEANNRKQLRQHND